MENTPNPSDAQGAFPAPAATAPSAPAGQIMISPADLAAQIAAAVQKALSDKSSADAEKGRAAAALCTCCHGTGRADGGICPDCRGSGGEADGPRGPKARADAARAATT